MDPATQAYIDLKFEELRKQIFESIKIFDTYTFDRHINLLNGVDIRLGGDKGSRIGTTTDDKLGFFGATPVKRNATPISNPSGGATIDSVARGVITDINTRLKDLGLFT
jgi:hypothetical protein